MKKSPYLFVLSSVAFALFFSASPLHAVDKSDYYRGLDLYHSGDYKGAVEAFEAQLEKTPDDDTVKKWAGLARDEVKAVEKESKAAAPQAGQPKPLSSAPAPLASKTKPAAASYASAPAAKPSGSAKDDYERGIAQYLEGNYPSAYESFKRYLVANPGHMATQQWITLVEGLLPKDNEPKEKIKKELPRVVNNGENLVVAVPKPKPAPKPVAAATTVASPAPAPAPKPVAAAPAPLPASSFMPKPAVAAPAANLPSREAALLAEIGRLRAELSESEAMTQRAIEQTKKALAVPSPSFQSYEEENVRKAMAAQIDELRAEQERLIAEVADWKNQNETLLKRVGALSSQKPAQVPSPETERKLAETQRALTEMTQRHEEALSARMSAESDGAREIAELKASQDRLLADAKRKDTALADAKEELRRSAAKLEDGAASRDRTIAQLTENTSKLEALLEESRSQGLRLVMDMQKERRLREELEERLARALAR